MVCSFLLFDKAHLVFEMTLGSPFLSVWYKIVPRPPFSLLVPAATSTINENVLSNLGYSLIGSLHEAFFRFSNAYRAFWGTWPFSF
jgi:hypothetical protein